MAIIIGFFLVLQVPTALVNFFILKAEFFHNQLAWRREDDFSDGLLFNVFDDDILHWFGIDENKDDYRERLQAITHKYF